MENLKYHDLIDKANWPKGAWHQEPDKEQWTDVKSGLPCLLVRQPWSGHLCGYVGVSASHPFFEKPYQDIEVDVHYGLTFSSKCMPHEMEEPKVCHIVCDDEDDNIWWLGFDCAHAGDVCPGSSLESLNYGSYKTVEFVKDQCQQLAEQLKSLT